MPINYHAGYERATLSIRRHQGDVPLQAGDELEVQGFSRWHVKIRKVLCTKKLGRTHIQVTVEAYRKRLSFKPL